MKNEFASISEFEVILLLKTTGPSNSDTTFLSLPPSTFIDASTNNF